MSDLFGNHIVCLLTHETARVFLGLLAWRKLLWNAKPGSTHPLVKTLKSRTYFKAGDFSNALKDFTSAVPDAKMTYGGKRMVCYTIISI